MMIFPDTIESPGAEACLHRMFEAQTARTPDADAVRFDGEALSYGDLNGRANRLARRLRASGVGPGSLVGVCLERSPEMVVALLGVLKSGGAYVPLDPEYPAERLAFLVADAQVEVLLTTTDLQKKLPPHAGATFLMDDDRIGLSDGDAGNLTGGAGPDDLAYVIYTSGSTGTPKGVLLAHRGACNNLQWRQSTFPLTAEDRLLQTYSFSFDPSVWAFFWPLTAGAAVVLPRPGEHGDPDRLGQSLQRERITVVGFSPSLLSALLDTPHLDRDGHLRHIFCGGEVLSPELRERVFAALPGVALHNVYGPTEATIDATWWTCRRRGAGAIVPIGHPLPRTQAYLLGKDGQVVAEGDTGELYLAGVSLAHGYLRRPELTAERFVPNPFCRDDEERALFPTLYRTGDLCRRRFDGAIEYLGRMDDQVKVRGFRIELGEIESALTRHPDVRAAAVTVREDAGGKRLAAYIVPTNRSLSLRSLRASVADALPSHMVPGAFVCLDALPLSPNGKLDRAALPAPTASDWERTDARVAPRTPLEKQLVGVFEELLGVSPLGVQDDFFEWGGHSLLAARLVAELERVTGQRLTLPDLMAGATSRRLADLLAREEEVQPTHPLMQRWNVGSTMPLFFWHGDFTGGFYCGDLAHSLGPEQTFYTFSPHGVNGTEIPATIEAMAADYIGQIRTVQPEGPYHLGGFCNGGLIAYEVARQFMTLGEEVRFLGLVDVDMPVTQMKLWLNGHVCRLARRVGLSGSAQERLSLAVQGASVPLNLALKRIRSWCEKLSRSVNPAPGPDWAEIIPEAYRRTTAFYHVRPYPGSLVLVWADEEMQTPFGHPADGWRELSEAFTFDTTPGSHGDCHTRHAHALGQRLRAHLRASSSGTAGSEDAREQVA